MKQYHIGIIGSGPGGYTAAIRAGQAGKSVCIIEKSKDLVGGVCLNEGCIPTKSIINSVNMLETIKEAEKCGVNIDFKSIEMSKIVNCSQRAVKKLKQGLLYLFNRNNIDLKYGTGKITGENNIKVIKEEGGEEDIKAENIIIATGSRPKSILGLEPDGKKIITSAEIIKLNYIPKRLLIIGGGAVGVEFASIFNNLGSDIIIIEMMDTLLPQEDKEIVSFLERSYKKRDIEVLTNSKIEEVNIKEDKIKVKIDKNGEIEEKQTDLILTAVGRIPNTENLGLEKVGLDLEQGGFIKINQNMQTSIPNIYAIGDVINTPMLAHAAFKEAEIAVDSILGNVSRGIDYLNVPNAIYSEPEIASLGMIEEEAKMQGLSYKVGKYFYKASGRAVVSNKEEGLVKVIVDARSNKILGAHIFGENATEIIHEFVLAKQNNLSLKGIIDTIHAHPTFSEMAVSACRGLL